jgi:hypothetical protein
MRCLSVVALIAVAGGSGMAQSADRATVAPAEPPPGPVSRMLGWVAPGEDTPLTEAQRWHDYWMGTIGPVAIFSQAAAAGLSQWENSPPEWGQGGSGLGKRFANDMAYNAVRNTLIYGTSIVFHEDNRYFASGKSTFGGRVLYALASPVMAKRSSGKRSISISGVTGIVGVSVISRAWSPPSWQGANNVAISAGLTYAGTAGYNLVREFVPDIIRRFRK